MWYKLSTFFVQSIDISPLWEEDENPFRYCGEYFDLSSSTYYLRARSYRPTTGRFLTEDTYWHPGNMIYGDSWNTKKHQISLDAIRQSSNLYVYTMNSPLRYCDPSGHKSEERLGKGIWSLKSDDLGIMIVSHWLYGGGLG